MADWETELENYEDNEMQVRLLEFYTVRAPVPQSQPVGLWEHLQGVDDAQVSSRAEAFAQHQADKGRRNGRSYQEEYWRAVIAELRWQKAQADKLFASFPPRDRERARGVLLRRVVRHLIANNRYAAVVPLQQRQEGRRSQNACK